MLLKCVRCLSWYFKSDPLPFYIFTRALRSTSSDIFHSLPPIIRHPARDSQGLLYSLSRIFSRHVRDVVVVFSCGFSSFVTFWGKKKSLKTWLFFLFCSRVYVRLRCTTQLTEERLMVTKSATEKKKNSENGLGSIFRQKMPLSRTTEKTQPEAVLPHSLSLVIRAGNVS